MITVGPNPEESHHLRIFRAITSAKFLSPRKVMCSRFWGASVGVWGEPLFCLPRGVTETVTAVVCGLSTFALVGDAGLNRAVPWLGPWRKPAACA